MIILAGALPATALLWLAHIPFTVAFSAFGEQPATAMLVIGWFGLATAGTIALWTASFRRVDRLLASGLVAGLIAMAPFWYFLAQDWVEDQSDMVDVMNIASAGPSLVAIILIIPLIFVRNK